MDLVAIVTTNHKLEVNFIIYNDSY